MDASRGNTILRSEFYKVRQEKNIWEGNPTWFSLKFCLMAARQKPPDRLEEEDSESTLTTHLFGIKGKHELSFDEFTSFVNGEKLLFWNFLLTFLKDDLFLAFQKEVLQTEFYEYSRGLDFITEEDFARILLRYMGLSAEVGKSYEHFFHYRLQISISPFLWQRSNSCLFQVFDSYLLRLSNRLPETSPGITFDEFFQFSMLLNNIEDFEIAAKFYELSGKWRDISVHGIHQFQNWKRFLFKANPWRRKISIEQPKFVSVGKNLVRMSLIPSSGYSIKMVSLRHAWKTLANVLVDLRHLWLEICLWKLPSGTSPLASRFLTFFKVIGYEGVVWWAPCGRPSTS